MKKKILISYILICIVLSFETIFIVNAVDNLENENNYSLEYNKGEQKEIDNIPNIGCKAVYIAEPKTGKIIYEKNSHEKMYPASTTKILTALVVLEQCQLSDTAVVSKNAISLVPNDYANAKLQVDEKLCISDLLYALLVQSANEAANVLAEHVSGSIESFMDKCNTRAEELGCEQLHFVNPNGIHDNDHYCTAYDLYLIAKECQKYDIFNEIVKTESFTLPATNMYSRNDRTFENTNSMILPKSTSYYYQYCTGIKTGHTDPAGECLIASSSRDNLDLISVVLGGATKNSNGLNDRFIDTKQLFDFTYNNYSNKKVVEKNQTVTNINVKKATKKTSSLDVIVNNNISSVMPNDIDAGNIIKEININDDISAPIKQGEVIGKITYKVDGLNYTTDLIASHEVKKKPYWIFNALVIFTVIILFWLITKMKNRKKRKKYHKGKKKHVGYM